MLPRGSTPVDFAFAVHSEVGNTCSGAVVNGSIAPLDYVLRNGDVLEIITNRSQRPSKIGCASCGRTERRPAFAPSSSVSSVHAL